MQFSDDGFCRFGPYIRLGIVIVLLDETLDGDFQVDDGMKDAVPKSRREKIEKKLSAVLSREHDALCELKDPVRMTLKQGHDVWMFLRPVSIDDDRFPSECNPRPRQGDIQSDICSWYRKAQHQRGSYECVSAPSTNKRIGCYVKIETLIHN